MGTAGHVDHGKTTLVKALTGVDTDRLPEERRREISIELGFAPLTLPDGTVASVVDVPGHERFIKNMLAGATGVDVALLVVDVREGVRPQTREHLDILGLLGIGAGVVALTKTDGVPPCEVARVAADLRQALAGTCLDGCPVVPVSAVTGEGLGELRQVLSEAVTRARAARPPASGPARLAVDRAFTSKGFGVVVTGTVSSGRITLGQHLELYPDRLAVRVRRLEVHGRPVEEVEAGDRAALALSGAPPPATLRGRVLADPGSLDVSRALGLSLTLLPSAGSLRDLERVRLHAGTTEVIGRGVILGSRPEGGLLVAFEAEKPLALAPGQPFVLRRYSPPSTIGGGRVIAPDLGKATGTARPRGRREREEVARRLATPAPAPRRLADGRTVDAHTYAEVREVVERTLRDLHRRQPHLPSVGREGVWSALAARGEPPGSWLETLAADGVLRLEGGRVRLAAWRPRLDPELARVMRQVEELLRRRPFCPPSPEEMAAELGVARGVVARALEVLVLDGAAVAAAGLASVASGGPVFHREAVAEARRLLEDYLRRHGSVTVAAFRDLLGATRKYALPLLDHFDRQRVTQRRGDLRFPHPAGAVPTDPGARRQEVDLP
ncbi:MAG: selenocysteine-specific translation elongation factor [Firmicutes bacterium]|nr:selenocysteine-specific translation elongation factor [Bacillota bacterium]